MSNKKYDFSPTSQKRLGECDARLQTLFCAVIRHVDCTIITGRRNQQAQNEMVRTGRSGLMYPQSMHNSFPARAVDVAPYPIDWQDRERATLFAGFVIGMGMQMGMQLRWGGDWDGDWQVRDNNFDDLWHFELVD